MAVFVGLVQKTLCPFIKTRSLGAVSAPVSHICIIAALINAKQFQDFQIGVVRKASIGSYSLIRFS